MVTEEQRLEFPSSVPPISGRSPAQNLRLAVLRRAGRFYASRPPAGAKSRSILLIRPDHLGDMLFLTPALAALRRALPSARLTVLVGPWAAGVLQANSDLDEVISCAFPGFVRQAAPGLLRKLQPYKLLLETARVLRSRRFDTAVTLRYDHWWGAWLAAAAGIPCRLGYAWPETLPFLTTALPYMPLRHEVEQNGALLAALAGGKYWQLGPLRYDVKSDDRVWATEWLAAQSADVRRPLVSIHVGAGAPVKLWPLASWARVADTLVATHGAQVILTGSADERVMAERLRAAMTQSALNAAGETTLGRLAALQERCALVMGSDSGPLHLAVAMKVPTIHLYGPVSPGKFGPWGDPRRHVALVSDWPCVSCHRLDWPASVLDQHRCMEAITVQQVVAAASRLLSQSVQRRDTGAAIMC